MPDGEEFFESAQIAGDHAYCEVLRKQQSQKISKLSKKLVEKRVLDDFGISEGICTLKPHFEGVIDIRDKVFPPKRELSTPSIGWECTPSECSIEADLPVPPWEEQQLKDFINNIPRCGVSQLHKYSGNTIPAETHVHVVCKGLSPFFLGSTVNSLMLEALKRRGHVV